MAKKPATDNFQDDQPSDEAPPANREARNAVIRTAHKAMRFFCAFKCCWPFGSIVPESSKTFLTVCSPSLASGC